MNRKPAPICCGKPMYAVGWRMVPVRLENGTRATLELSQYRCYACDQEKEIKEDVRPECGK